MGDAGPRSPSPAEVDVGSDGARQSEVTVLVTGFGVCSFFARCIAIECTVDVTYPSAASCSACKLADTFCSPRQALQVLPYQSLAHDRHPPAQHPLPDSDLGVRLVTTSANHSTPCLSNSASSLVSSCRIAGAAVARAL